MVTFANLGSVRLPSLKFVGLRLRKIRCICQLSIYNSFPVIAKNRHFYVPRLHFFVCPGDAPAAITQNVVWMKRQFSVCQTPRIMYLSIFDIFRVIRCLSQCVSPKSLCFITFLFPVETPLRLSRNTLHGWKDNSMLAKRLAACTYLSWIFSELYDA